jgi:hypothetical protein
MAHPLSGTGFVNMAGKVQRGHRCQRRRACDQRESGQHQPPIIALHHQGKAVQKQSSDRQGEQANQIAVACAIAWLGERGKWHGELLEL